MGGKKKAMNKKIQILIANKILEKQIKLQMNFIAIF